MLKEMCSKCWGQGLTYHRSEYIGNYSVRCSECDGSGNVPRRGLKMLALVAVMAVAWGIGIWLAWG